MIKINGKNVSRIPINGKETLRVMQNGQQLWSGSGLPAGYTLLEYIESTGQQYIDTGFVPNQDTRIEMVVSPTSVANINGTAGFAPYGAGDTSTRNAFECYSWASKCEFHYGSQYKYEATIYSGDILHIDHNKNYVSLYNVTQGTTWNYTFNTASFTAPRNLYLSACYQSKFYYGNQKIYSCQIYDNGVLVRDFIPVKDMISGTYGLYDKVNKLFYESASPTPFTGV